MPICLNNPKKSYKGDEPSPKGLGYCASGEKEGIIMSGRDGLEWIKKDGRWIKHENFKEILNKKLFKWWLNLSNGAIIVIFKDGTHLLVKSNKKTGTAQSKEILKKWIDYGNNKDVEAIIWSSISSDTIQFFIEFLIKKTPKPKMKELISLKDFPNYLLNNYKKYFEKYEHLTSKDYVFKRL